MKQHLVERELTSEGPRRSGGVAPRRRSVTVNLAESPLADYERAQIAPGVTMRWDPVRIRSTNDGVLSPGERQVAARQRFDGAIAAAGKGLQDILWRVVCACETVTAAEKELEWPARSGKLVLRLALERVADFYRIG